MVDLIREGLQDYEDELEEERKTRAREAKEIAEIQEDILVCELELMYERDEDEEAMTTEKTEVEEAQNVGKCSKHGTTEFEEPNQNGDCYCKKCLKEAIDEYCEALEEFTKYPIVGFSRVKKEDEDDC